MNEKGKLPKCMLVLTGLCFLMYFLYGIYFNSVGANAENMMSFFRVTESRQGMILTVQSVACIGMTVVLGLFGERINKLYGLMAGLAVLGAAAIAIGTIPQYRAEGSGFSLLLIFVLIGGFGLITLDLLMNGAIADLFPKQKNTLLPVVHAFFGTGSMLAPLAVTALANPSRPETYANPYLALGGAALLAALAAVLVMKKAKPMTPYADMKTVRARTNANPTEIFTDARAWLFLLCCMLYSCFQIGLSAWLPQYAQAKMDLSYELANTMLTLYFLGALAARFLSPLVYRRMSVKTFYVLSLSLSALVFLAFLFLPLPFIVRCILLVLTGLLQGPAVPAQVILCCDTFPTRTASASSLVVLGISLASLVAPAAIGALIESVGYQLPMVLIAAAVLLSVGVLLWIGRIRPKQAVQ